MNGDASSKLKISRYSYQMYAIVHLLCEQHAKVLERLGYKIMVRDHPVKKEDIKGEWLRNHIESENCCGSAEFIKLYGKFLFLFSEVQLGTWGMQMRICLLTLLTFYLIDYFNNLHPVYVLTSLGKNL